jgi:hypothetical protein
MMMTVTHFAHSRASGNPESQALGPRSLGDERMSKFLDYTVSLPWRD